MRICSSVVAAACAARIARAFFTRALAEGEGPRPCEVASRAENMPTSDRIPNSAPRRNTNPRALGKACVCACAIGWRLRRCSLEAASETQREAIGQLARIRPIQRTAEFAAVDIALGTNDRRDLLGI